LRVTTGDTSTGSRLFKVNGQRIYLRGGGWASDLLLRWDPARLAAEMGYVLHLGLNMIRLEGKLEADAFYDRADELGIVLLPGWMCCDVWEMQGGWNDVQRAVARESMRSQAARLRNHPSVAAFLIGSDRAPPADVASAYTMALQSVGWPNPIINAASDEGGSGLKMTGPYDWVPPNFWYEDTENGGAFGFNSETGPGAAIPELETLRGFLGQAELDSLWMAPMATQFHAGTPGMSFDSLRIFQRALSSRLGAATSLEDWVSKAQLTNYEAERAEFESYGSRRYDRATGLVHWLLNNSWPSLIWHLYDYSLLPAASFYGARKANEPLHPVLAYDDRSVQVVNNTQKAESGLTVTARVIDADGVERSSQDFPVSVMADASARAGVVAQPAGVTPLTFVDLELRRGDTLVSANTYWLSARKDLPDYDAGGFPTTPTSQFADFTALSRLAPATVKAAVTMTSAAGDARLAVTLENTSTKLAFFLRLLLRGAGGTPAVPVFWDDNYVTLRPGTRRTITVSAPAGAVGATPTVEVQGINVAKLAASP
jgi:exo-1,4-beta-D-glucosaminidase